MNRTRRHLLAAGGALGAALWMPAIHAAAAPRVVVVGGGWGGLAAARRLRQQAPGLDVTLVDRSPAFFSLPLSNRWLVGRLDAAMLRFDLRERAAALGYRFVAAEVGGIDRARRELATSAGAIGYDWLVLACGIRQDWGAWTGGDAAAARRIEAACGNGFEGGEALHALKARLDRFAGGELLMNIPPMPYRCPPAPYERALLIASEIRRRRLKARLTILDPGAGILGFPKVFADRWRDEVRFVPHTSVLSVDLDAKRVATEVQDFDFDTAILMPPQQAGALVAQAGLGGANGWADVSPFDLRAAADPRVFVVGDAVGNVSPLFGAYPKSGHVAVRLGQIAADAIARDASGGGGAAGAAGAAGLPDSVCHVLGDVDPPEAIRIDARYRMRGDGVIAQTVAQVRDPQPRDEDLAWAKAMFAEMFSAT